MLFTKHLCLYVLTIFSPLIAQVRVQYENISRACSLFMSLVKYLYITITIVINNLLYPFFFVHTFFNISICFPCCAYTIYYCSSEIILAHFEGEVDR